MEEKKGWLDFTGSEKAAVALAPLLIPLNTLIQACMAYWDPTLMPDPMQIRDAISFFLMTILASRLVWQVPNSGVVKADTVTVQVDPSAQSQVAVNSNKVEDIKVEQATVESPVKESTIEENPV